MGERCYEVIITTKTQSSSEVLGTVASFVQLWEEDTILIPILQMRKSRPRQLRELVQITDLMNVRIRIKLQYSDCRTCGLNPYVLQSLVGRVGQASTCGDLEWHRIPAGGQAGTGRYRLVISWGDSHRSPSSALPTPLGSLQPHLPWLD